MNRSALVALAFLAGLMLPSSLSAQSALTGPGCPGFISPSIQCQGSPVVCSPLPVLFGIGMAGGAPLQPAVLVLGVDAPATPIPSFPMCMSGCAITLAPVAFLPTTTNLAGEAQHGFALPCDPSLIGQSVEAQWGTIDPSGIIVCAVATPEMRVTLQ